MRPPRQPDWIMRGLASLAVWGMAAVVLTWPAGAVAQDQPTLDQLLNLDSPPAASSSDEASEADPASESLDGSSDTPSDASSASPGVELSDEVARRVAGESGGDLFKQAVREMDDAAERLARANDAGLDTQRTQQSVLDKLDQLIADAKKQQGGGGGSSGQNQQQQQQQGNAQNQGRQPGQAQGQSAQPSQGQANASSGEHSGDVSPGSTGPVSDEASAIEEYRQEWGNLPPRLRGELMEGLQEHFSPLYRSLTEAYYRELAQEAQ